LWLGAIWTMDWDNIRGEKPRPPAPLPTLQLLETNCA
jgi:hypothetical protein